MARCTALAKSTGLPCRNPSVNGAVVCKSHGGNTPQVRAKALERWTMQAALMHDRHRTPEEVIAEAMHVHDVYMRHCRNVIAAGARSHWPRHGLR